MGYKKEALNKLQLLGLPILRNELWHYAPTKREIDVIQKTFNGRWSLRVDTPEKKEGLPVLTVDDITNKDLSRYLRTLKKNNPHYQFLFSESPKQGHLDRMFNVVSSIFGDVLIGEFSREEMTLRDCWTKGRKLKPFVIDGSVGDFLRNKNIFNSVLEVESLREVRRLILGTVFEFELTIMASGKIVFWQILDLSRKETVRRRWVFNEFGGV